MRFLRLIFLLLFSFGCLAQNRSTSLLQKKNLPVDSLFMDFITRTLVRYDSVNPVLLHTDPYENSCPAGIVTDPLDHDKFIFYRGEFLGSISVDARVTYFIGDKSDPFDLGTLQGVILAPGGSGSVDENGARFGCVLEVGGIIYYYYVGIDASYTWRICLATSTDGRTFTKQGVVLDVTVEEPSVSDPVIIYYNGRLEMAYTIWSGPVDSQPNHNPGFSNEGIKLATSTDFTSWTREDVALIPIGPSGSFYDNNVEGGQLFKFNYTYAYFFNANDGSPLFTWTIGVGYTPWPNTDDPLTNRFYIRPTTPFFGPCATCWDDRVVAVPLLHLFPSGWVMYYQAYTNGSDDIDIGAATFEH